MFDEKTILARLQHGEDASTIANEMTAAINSAMKTYEDQKKKEAEAEKAKQNQVQKKKELEAILSGLRDWTVKWYGVSEEATATLNADDVMELIDSVNEYVDALKGLEVLVAKPKAIQKKKVSKTADDTIEAFLKQMGW